MNKTWMGLTLAVAAGAVAWQLATLRGGQLGAGGRPGNMDELAPAQAVSEQVLPDIEWNNIDGGKNRLTEWQDKVLIVNNWATWCEPCRREIPMFMDVQARYADQGVVLIGLAHDELDVVRRYVGEMGMDYPQLIADIEQGSQWLKTLGNNGSLPLTLVYDKQGRLRAKKLGLMSGAELEQAVTGLL